MELVADLHIHTIASGHAYCTLEEMVQGAKNNGIKIMGTTDHGPNMPGGPHIYHFGNLKVIPEEIKGVKIIKGVEANITDINGSLDLSSELLAKLDLVLIGFHVRTGYEPQSKAENTEAMINAICNPLVDIVVHPGNPAYQIDIDKIIEVAKEEETLLEINNSSYRSRPGSKERCIEIARKAKKEGLEVVLSTDSHHYTQVGQFDKAIRIVDEAGLTADDILNTTVDKVEEFIAKKRKEKDKILNSI